MLQQFHENNKQIYLASSLYDSIEDNDLNAVKILLEKKGANPNIVLPDKGITPFHLAVGNPKEYHAEEITSLFLCHGGDPNVRSDDNMTPVHVSAAWGRLNVLKLLVKYGGDIKIKDDEGYTALDYAKVEEHLNVVNFLLELNNNLFNETQDKNYKLTLEKLIINNGIVVAEYSPNLSDTNYISVKNHLNNLPEAETNHYVQNWCVKHANVTNESYNIGTKNLNETFTIDISENCDGGNDSKFIYFDDIFITNRRNKNYFNETIEKNQSTNSSVPKIIDTITIDSSSNDNILEQSKEIISNDLNRHEPNDRYEHALENITISDIIEIESSTENVFEINIQNTQITDDFQDVSISSNELLTDDILESTSQKSLLITSDESIVNYSRESGIKTLSNYSTSFQNSLVPIHEPQFIGPIEDNTSTELSKYETCSESIKGHEMNIFDSIISSDMSGIENIANEVKVVEDSNLKHVTNVPCQISECVELDESFFSVAEEYKYTDKEDGVVLIERRYLVKTQIDTDDKKSTGDDKNSSRSTVSSLPTTIEYDTDTLRKELTYRGEEPGPITSTTKRLYLRKLMRLQKNPSIYSIKPSNINRVYSIELEKSIRNLNWKDDLSQYQELESTMCQQFSKPDPTKKWREGLSKVSFTYLLLDPRITQNLPIRSEKLTTEETWKLFLSSIFYVGKGKRSRPYAHLYDAFNHWEKNVKKVTNKKIQHILDIWNDGKGVVCLHIFQNVIPVEAYTREAAIISAIKLQNLKNAQNGNFYGISDSWPQRQKRLLGVYLLYRAMLIFLNEGERQLRPNDI